MTRLKLALLALALPLLTTCQGADPNAVCTRICTPLATCGMLPSALGIADEEGLFGHTAVENCVARCNASAEPGVRQLAACIDPIEDLAGASDDTLWCEPNGQCSKIASCIEQYFGDAAVTGTGRTQVEFVAVSDITTEAGDIIITMEDQLLRSGLVGCETVALHCMADPGSDLDLDVFCENGPFPIERVEVLLESTESAQVLASGTCREVLGQSISTEPLGVGRYQLALRVFGGNDDSGPGQCSKFYGETIIISSGTELCQDDVCRGYIPLPSTGVELLPVGGICGTGGTSQLTCDDPTVVVGGGHATGFPCEHGLIACSDPDDASTCKNVCVDDRDNDCDGLADCNDPACSMQCEEAGHCADGVDNDNDGMTDCQDMDCDSDSQCSTTTTGGGTGGETDTGTSG